MTIHGNVLLLIAALWAFMYLALRVPPEARNIWYYLNGAALLLAIGALASRSTP